MNSQIAMRRTILVIAALLATGSGFAAQPDKIVDLSYVSNPIIEISMDLACFPGEMVHEDTLRLGARVLAQHRLADMVTSRKISMSEAERAGARFFNHGYELFQDQLAMKGAFTGGCSTAFKQSLGRQFDETSAVMDADVRLKNFNPFPSPARDRLAYAEETLRNCVLYGSTSLDGPAKIIATPSQAAKLCDKELGEYRYREAVERGVDDRTAREQAEASYHSNGAIAIVESIQRDVSQ